MGRYGDRDGGDRGIDKEIVTKGLIGDRSRR